MKKFTLLFFISVLAVLYAYAKKTEKELKLFKADNSRIQYTGRIDFSNPEAPRIWAPGVYIKARFKGNRLKILINDEVPDINNHNYLEIVIDDKNPYRIKLNEKVNIIALPEGLSDTEHVVMICKDTESNIGYIDFVGFRCEKLLSLPAKPKRNIEYFGDSITSGTGMDLSTIPCGKGQWYDQHNAYMSYGALASRNLGAEWQLTALAGLGLVHSCCDLKVTMPLIYDKVFLMGDSIRWNFKTYQPDVVTVCLGQNDGPQDSLLFCDAYVKLIQNIRQHCSQAAIVCLNSPMADEHLTAMLKNYLAGITGYINGLGDKKVYKYFFSRAYNNGCGGHPDMADHQLIASELTAYIKQLKGW